MARKKPPSNQPRPGTFWDSRADPRGYGVDPVKAAGLMFAAAKKAREDQENYEYWRQNAGLTSTGAISTGAAPGATPNGAAAPGVSLVGNQIVVSGTTAPMQPKTQGAGVTDVQRNVPQTGGEQSPQETQTLQANGTNMTDEEVEQAKEIMSVVSGENPIIGFGKGTLHWLSEVFNFEDTYGSEEADPVTGTVTKGDGGDMKLLGLIPLGGLENRFDAGLMALDWGYDRLSQGVSYGVSNAPGGAQPLSWEQADDVSWGQAAGTDLGIRRKWLDENGFNIPTFNGSSGGNIFGMYGTIASAFAAGPSAQEGFDLTSEEDKYTGFGTGPLARVNPETGKSLGEEQGLTVSEYGRWTTGLLDAGLIVAADPGIIAGKALKVLKLRQLDRLINTEQDVARVIGELDDGASKMAQNMQYADPVTGAPKVKPVERMTDAEIDELKLAPTAMFAQKVVQRQVDELGNEVVDEATGRAQKAMTLDDIYYHKVIKNASNRDALSAALYNARNYEEASAILKHAAGSTAGTKYLNEVRPDMLLDILTGERAIVSRAIGSNPAVVSKAAARWEERGDQIMALIKQADRVGMDDAVKSKLYAEYDRVFTMWEQAKYAKMPPVGVGPTATKAEIALLEKAAAKRLESDRNFFLSLERARGGRSETWGALQGSTKGFSADNKFGRWAERARQGAGTQRAVAESGRAARSERRAFSPYRIWDIEEFRSLPDNMSTTRKAFAVSAVSRVWHWAGSERPSGLITTAGIGSQESAREMRAVLDSLSMYGGEGKTITKDGTTRVVGGEARKADLLRQYQNAMLKGDVAGQADARRIIDTLESNLIDDMSDYYGLSADTMRAQHYITNGKMRKIGDDIREKGYWVDEDGSTNYAPYLESQLQNSTFMKNWRGIEDVARKEGMGPGGSAWEATTFNVGRLNSAMQQVWRPMVLIRGGYTQRNIAEGTFRQAALTFSLRPIGNIFGQAALSTRNRAAAVGGRSVKANRAVEAAKSGLTLDSMPKRFRKWHDSSTQAAELEMTRLMDTVDTALEPLLSRSAALRADRVAKIDGMIAEFTRVNGRLDPVKDAGQIARNQTEAAALTAQKQKMAAWTDDDLDPSEVTTLIENVNYIEDKLLENARLNRNGLDDMLEASADYRKQTLANRRLYDGAPKDATDPETMDALFKGLALQDPFDPNSNYAQIALANLSADSTVRQALGMRSETVAQAWSHDQFKHYTRINPGHKNYYPSVARVLNQWNESAVGRVIIEGRADGLTDDEIVKNVADRLFNQTDGADIRKALWEADELKFSPDDPGGRAMSIKDLRAKAQADADKAVADLDDEIDLLTQKMTQYGKAYTDALDEFAKSGRKTEHRMVLPGPNGPTTRRFKSKASMDAYMNRQVAKLSKKEKARQDKWDEEATFAQEKNRINLSTVDDATQYASNMLERYDQLTAGSVPLQRWLRTTKLEMAGGNTGPAGKLIEGFLDAKDANGNRIYDLAPVLGDDVMRVGPRKLGEGLRQLTDKTFSLIGTMPEDVFTRAPFYGLRYRESARRALKILEDEVGSKNITIDDVNAIRNLAHRRALKDTKDWLYTIDRRTRFGDVMENYIPFASATQNSVTAVGRLIWNDPSIPAVMALIWQAPDALNDPTDPENPDAFALPVSFLSKEQQTLLGVDGYVRWNKKSFDLITQGTFDFTAGPLISVSSSEAMKNGFFGAYTAGTPEWLKLGGAIPDDAADALWQEWKNRVYGEGFGVSEKFASVDKVVPTHITDLLDIAQSFFTGEGSSARYTDTIQSALAQQKLEFVQGTRTDPPNYDEAVKLAQGMGIIKWAIRMGSFTPPKYVSEIDNIVAAVRASESAYRDDQALPEGQRLGVPPPYAIYGDAIMWVADSNSQRVNTAGMPASFDAEAFARNHKDLIRDAASQMVHTDDLTLLAMYVPDIADHYSFDDAKMQDPSVKAVQMAMTIPGAGGETYRELADPAYMQYRAGVESAWDVYIRGKQSIEAVMNQKGIFSWTSAAARPYKEKKDELVASLSADKRYEGWYDEFELQQGGTRTRQAIIGIQKGLGNESFRKAMVDDPIWGAGGAAEQYVANWNAVTVEMNRLGIGDLESKAGGNYRGQLDGLAQVWEESRTAIARSTPDWAIFESRFLGDSPNPFPVGTYVEQFDVQTEQPMMAPDVFPAGAPQDEFEGAY